MKGFLVLALLGAFTVSIEGSKCDPHIIAKIKALNCKVPESPIAAAIANGKEVVVGTTLGYYPAGTRCLFSVFTKDSFTAIRVPEQGCAVITTSPVKDIPEGTIQPDLGIKRYHVIQEKAVTGFYKCGDNEKEGAAQGLIKVAESTEDHSALIKKAKEALKGVGVDIVDKYPSACP